MAITGNIDVPGGKTSCHDAFDCSADYDCGSQYVPQEAASRRLSVPYAYGTEGTDPNGDVNADAVLHCIETGHTPTGEPYPIKMLWFQGENGIACPSWDAPRA